MDESQQETQIGFDQQARISRSLGVILPAIFIAGVAVTLIMVLSGQTRVALALSIGLIVLLVSYHFHQRGSFQIAAATLIAVLLIVITYLVVSNFGIHDTAMLLFPVAIVAASILFDTKWFAGISLIVMALIAGIVLGEVWGIYTTPFSAETSLDDLIIIELIILLTAIPVRILSENLRGALFVAERSRSRYLGIFDGAPVSIWVEDITGMIEVLDRLKESSPEGIKVYLDNHPEAVLDIAGESIVVDVNNSTVEMFEADSKDQFLSEHHKTFTPETVEAIKKMLVAVATGAPNCHTQSEFKTLKGKKIDALVSLAPVSPDDGWVDQALVSITDITAQKRLEAELSTHEQKIRQAYTDVLEAVTQEKLVVRGKHEIEEVLGVPMGGSMPVIEFSDLESSRRFLRRIIRDSFSGFNDQGAEIIACGEAVVNGVKHGGSCMLQVYKSEMGDTLKMQVAVRDYGPGIDFLNLPRAVLVAGFSTKTSLGMGFTIMLDICDQLLLATDETGTTVVLEFNQKS